MRAIVSMVSSRIARPTGLLGVLGLTAVEQDRCLEAALPDAFKVMFVAVLVMNTGFAIDTFLTFKRFDSARP